MYNKLVNAHLKLHFLFNGWITHSSKYSSTNIYIHYFNYQDKVINYLIALPEQPSRYTGINYAAVIGDVLAHFKVTKESLSYFITNNARNNNTYLNYLATVFNFRKDDRRIRYAAYTLNLVA